jgi:hypothetical protein
MATTSVCAVCQQAASGAGLNRVGGADVCNRCYLGDAPRHISKRGWSLSIRQYDRVINKEGDRLYFTEATLKLPMSGSVHFKCRRKTIGWRLVGLFLRGPKSGDDIFDRHVFVRSKTPKAAQALLSDDGVQSIVLDMLGEGSWLTVAHAMIDVYSCRPEYVPEAKFSSEMCVLASHFIRLQG